MTSSRRNTAPDGTDAELRAIVQLRMSHSHHFDAKLNEKLEQQSPAEILAQTEIADPAKLERRTDRALRMMLQDDVVALTSASPSYPRNLQLYLGPERPPILFLRGRTELLDSVGIAIVGARNSTEYGDSVTEMLAGDLARRGYTIISGLARGIDSIAHRAALAMHGNTIAVLGCGIDVLYPPGNARLQQRIASEGLLISEFAPGSPAHHHHFPQRNRIIAQLGHGVLVVEASHRSGTRHTVDCALLKDRDVFAVPGPIGRKESEGTNEAIRDGAFIVTSVADILMRLPKLEAPACDEAEAADVHQSPQSPESPQSPIYSSIDVLPVHVDDIARRAGVSTAEALAQLLELELDGYATQHAGKRFSRTLR